MAEKITKKLYGGEVEIDFYPDAHRYKLAGSKTYLISVTSATGILDKSRVLIPWAINLAGAHLRRYLENASGNQFTSEELLPVIEEALQQHKIKKEEAAGVGSQVHKFAEQFALAKLDLSDYPSVENDDERVVAGITAFLDWYTNNKVKFLEVERMLYSRKYGYVGLTDVIAEVNGRKLIMDYKTAKGIYSEHYYQLSGYWAAFEEETGVQLDGAAILHFDKETGLVNVKELSREDHEMNYPVFLACYEIKKREKELSK
jgi:hypothetical protein